MEVADKAGFIAGSETAVVRWTSYTLGENIIVVLDGAKIADSDALPSYLAECALAGQF